VPTAASNVVFPASASFTTPLLTANGIAASLLFDAGATSYALSSNAGVNLSGVNAITVSATTTAAQTINLTNIASGSLLFPSGQNLTITNNATATIDPTLVIGPNTVIGTPGSLGIVVSGTGTTTISGSFADSSGPNNQARSGTFSGVQFPTLAPTHAWTRCSYTRRALCLWSMSICYPAISIATSR
jgi:hypothetical protein